MSRVRCRIGDVVRCGRAISFSASVSPTTVARAVECEPDSDAQIAVVAAEPGPVHEHVGCIRPAMRLRTRTALAAAARSRGLETPHDGALEDAREQLAALAVDGSADERMQHRRAAAQATAETETLREVVAAARGRLEARREAGLDPTPAADDLADAVARLSEGETVAAAAEQRLETVRESAREHRDDREERFRLEDRVANLERRARAHLVAQVEDGYAGALAAVPDVSGVEDPFAAAPVARALAVARIAEVDAPVVLACRRFEGPSEAADWLDAPVIRLPQSGDG